MLDKIPLEVFDRVTSFLSQEDRVSLTYVSRKLYHRILPSIYGSIYLNVKPYFPSDLDRSLGTSNWSVLYFTKSGDNNIVKSIANFKLGSLIRSLKEKPYDLPKLVKRVNCTWHLDKSLLNEFVDILVEFGDNLKIFEDFLDESVATKLSLKGDQMQSIVVTPPSVLPKAPADNNYFSRMELLTTRYKWDNIQHLTLHVNACTFFPHFAKPLKIKSLSLNVRPDTLGGTFLHQPFYHIFDVDVLESLEILSWYGPNQVEFNLYELWNLEEFYEFHKIKEFTLLSLPADRNFLLKCITNFPCLQRLKVDYMLDVPLSALLVDSLSQYPCSQTLQDIDFKFEELDAPIISIRQDEISNFTFNVICKCPDCRGTFQNVILNKYFADKSSLIVKDFSDVESRNFTLQLFKLYPILPYTHFVDLYPSIGFYCKSLEAHAEKVNALLGIEANQENKVTTSDVLKLYHMHIHSLKKSWNFFLQRFPQLKFLTLNDIPTKVQQVDKQQKCNIPIFYSEGYKTNQVYELVDDESLFD